MSSDSIVNPLPREIWWTIKHFFPLTLILLGTSCLAEKYVDTYLKTVLESWYLAPIHMGVSLAIMALPFFDVFHARREISQIDSVRRRINLGLLYFALVTTQMIIDVISIQIFFRSLFFLPIPSGTYLNFLLNVEGYFMGLFFTPLAGFFLYRQILKITLNENLSSINPNTFSYRIISFLINNKLVFGLLLVIIINLLLIMIGPESLSDFLCFRL